MSTLTCVRPTVKPTARRLGAMYLADRGLDAAGLDDPTILSPADRASLARIMGVEVKGLAYQVEPLTSPDGPAYRLTSPAGKVYDVEDTANGSTCDCPDYVCRRAGLDAAGCKHVKALKAAGLIANACTAAPLISNEPAAAAPADALCRSAKSVPAVPVVEAAAVTTVVVKAAPAAVPVYSPETAVEAALLENRACLWPASENYKVNMGRLADRTDRVAALMAEPLPPAEARHAVEAEPGNDGATTADAWPAWTDEFRWELGAGEGDDEGGSTFEGWAAAPPSSADPAAVAAAFVTAWLADLADPRSHLYAAKLPARPSADERPVRLRTPRRTNVGSCYGDEDQLRNHGCV